MNEKNTNYLISNYPLLYADCDKKPWESCMAFGFEVGDGWFDIINELSAKLEPLGAVATQVKEKYGTLRFYVHTADEEAFDYIDDAELASESTCEMCGRPGEWSDSGWCSVRCGDCD